MVQERLLPVPLWFNEIEARGISLVPAVYEKILLDLKREEATLGEPPNYFSFIAVKGAGKFFTSHTSYSVAPPPWNSLAIFVNLRRTEEDGLQGYLPRGFREELTGLETEIHFQLPGLRPFISNSEALLNWANWFLEAEERTVVVRGKFNIAAGRATNQKWIGEPLTQEQLISLKEFLEGYLDAETSDPRFIMNVRRDLARLNTPEAQELLQANELLNNLYALAIGL